jgi:hypothetical protein
MFLCWKNDEFSTCKRVMLIPRTTVETRSEDAVQNNASDQSEMRTVREDIHKTHSRPWVNVGISKEGTGTDMGRRGNPGRKRGE